MDNHPKQWRHLFPWPQPEGHKYGRGSVLVVGGPAEMAGAAKLAAMAALRMGAGLVTIACRDVDLPVYASSLMAVMTRSYMSMDALEELFQANKYSTLVMGPGMGKGETTRRAVLTALATGKPTVLDADALTSFERDTKRLLKALHDKVVMTPHTGEFEKLYGVPPEVPQEAAQEAAAHSSAALVLKGPNTMIVQNQDMAINKHASPWLATAGSGDVLAGMIGAMLANQVDAFTASCIAVWCHGEAARLYGPGLISEDLPGLLPEVIRGLLK